MPTGGAASGQTAPSEPELVAAAGVSRGTIRHAIALLRVEVGIRTSRGTKGGSVAMLPMISHVVDFMGCNPELLRLKNEVTHNEFPEAGGMTAGCTVRQTAVRRYNDSLAALPRTLADGERGWPRPTKNLLKRESRTAPVDVCRNSLLWIPAASISAVLLERSPLEPGFPEGASDKRDVILGASVRGDADQADELLAAKLTWLTGVQVTV